MYVNLLLGGQKEGCPTVNRVVERRSREGDPTTPPIPPGLVRGVCSLSSDTGLPAPGWTSIMASTMDRLLHAGCVHDAHPCGSVWENPMGRGRTLLSGPQECEGWYASSRRVA